MKGIIYIQSAARVEPIVIAENTFSYNAAYFGAVGIYIRQQMAPGKYLNSLNPTSESDLQCGNYYIYKNSFSDNFGCPAYVTSVVTFDCVDDANTYALNDGYTFTAPVFTAATLTSYKANANTYAAIVPSASTVVGGSYTVYTQWVIFDSNTYTSNYVSNAKGILTIRGTSFVTLKSETFTNNGDMFNEKLTEYAAYLPIIKDSSDAYSYENILTSSTSTIIGIKVN